MIDLHCHSTASDGSYSPDELLKMAENLGITHLALTDHDTTDGLEQFFKNKSTVNRIPGIEISVYFEKGELHLVGLFVDRNNSELSIMEKEIKQYRKERNEKMLESLSKLLKRNVTINDLTSNPEGQLGRPHVAKYLVKNGVVATINDAFEQYLKDGGPLAVKKQHVPVSRAIDVIKKSGGLAILAHPSTLKQTDENLEKLILEYKSLGLDGVEAYSSHSPSDKKEVYADIALKNGLIVSCGSDFHGANGKVASLGADLGMLSDDYILKPLYERLKSN